MKYPLGSGQSIDYQKWFLEEMAGIHDQRLDHPVGSAANSLAKVLIRKRNDDDTPLLFDDIMKRDQPLANDDIQRTNTEDDDLKLSDKLKQFVQVMVRADPSKSAEQHLYSLLNSAHGRKLAEHLNNLTKKELPMPQVDILKVIAVTEDALMAQAKLQKRAGESDAKAFARLYEDDIEYRKQWRDLTDAKHLHGYLKSLASLKPTSTETGSTLVSDDSAEAIRLLNEMATKQGRKFEDVFADPNNKALAGRTYTGAHRPTASSTSGSELQR